MNVNHRDPVRHAVRSAASAAAISLIALGIAYPAAGVLLGELFFPVQAGGSLIERDSRIIGSELVGQSFEADRYLIGRPSAVDYAAAAVGGSNLAPSNPALRELIAERAGVIAGREREAPARLPADAVTASGAGIDPHVSPAYAELQVARIAAARGITPEQVRAVIQAHTQAPTFGILGQPRVHVLHVNLALDDPELMTKSPRRDRMAR